MKLWVEAAASKMLPKSNSNKNCSAWDSSFEAKAAVYRRAEVYEICMFKILEHADC